MGHNYSELVRNNFNYHICCKNLFVLKENIYNVFQLQFKILLTAAVVSSFWQWLLSLPTVVRSFYFLLVRRDSNGFYCKMYIRPDNDQARLKHSALKKLICMTILWSSCTTTIAQQTVKYSKSIIWTHMHLYLNSDSTLLVFFLPNYTLLILFLSLFKNCITAAV